MISVRHPRGRPPVAVSTSDTPVRTISGTGRDCQSGWPPRTDSNCFWSTAAGMMFAISSPVLYFYSMGREGVNPAKQVRHKRAGTPVLLWYDSGKPQILVLQAKGEEDASDRCVSAGRHSDGASAYVRANRQYPAIDARDDRPCV